MKLKKIASLLLAGVMAVSMLTACDSKGSSSSEGEGDAQVTPVTGAAAVMNETLSKNKSKISFTENEVVSGILTNYFKANPIKASDWNNAANTVGNGTSAWYVDVQNSVKDVIGASTSSFGSIDTTCDDDRETNFEMYVVNTKYLTKEDTLRMAAQRVDDLDLISNNKVGNNPANKNFSYTGTVAAIEAESKGGTESVWVVVVTITQTATDK